MYSIGLMGGNELKKYLLFLVLWVAVIGVIGCSNVDNSNIAKLIQELKAQDLKVKDITEEVKKEIEGLDEIEATILLVDEKEQVIIEIPEDVEKSLEEKLTMYTSPVILFTGAPHLFTMDELVISYFGQNEKLLNALEETLGKSLVNRQ